MRSTRGKKLRTVCHVHPHSFPPPPFFHHRYFAMFSGMGWETVTGCRQYFYIRHIDWAITCPLIIFSLGILATQDLATTLAGEGEFAVSFGFFSSFFCLRVWPLPSGGCGRESNFFLCFSWALVWRVGLCVCLCLCGVLCIFNSFKKKLKCSPPRFMRRCILVYMTCTHVCVLVHIVYTHGCADIT